MIKLFTEAAMRKLLLLCLLLSLAALSYAAHDFTVNGSDEPYVSVGDTLVIQFAYEGVGSAADISIGISAVGYDFDLYSTTNTPLMDGVAPDESGVDGTFLMHLENRASLPEDATLIITVTAQKVSDTVNLHFQQLDSTFYLHGTVQVESGWVNLPVPYALVYTFYNASAEEIAEMLENFELESFLTWLEQDHYFLSDMTGLLGAYELYVPDTIPNVYCTTGVYSALDVAGNYVAPNLQSVTVNGAAQANFLYLNPDGYLAGEVTDELGNIVTDAVLTLTQDDNYNFIRVLSPDSTGAFSVPLVNGAYTLTCMASGYLTWQQDFTLSGDDVWMDVVLELDVTWVSLNVYVRYENGEPCTTASMDLTWLDHSPNIVFSDETDSLGCMYFDVPTGYYNCTYYVEGYSPYSVDLYIEENSQLGPIIVPGSNVAETTSTLISAGLYPNPFNPETTLSFSLTTPAQVRATVYAVRGRRVCTLADEAMTAGEHSLHWQGRDDQGRAVASGVYLLRVQAGGRSSVFKAVLLK